MRGDREPPDKERPGATQAAGSIQKSADTTTDKPKTTTQPQQRRPETLNGHQPNGLRAALEAAGGSLKSLTVLAPQNDPFRVDTDAGHRDGAWLANTLGALENSRAAASSRAALHPDRPTET